MHWQPYFPQGVCLNALQRDACDFFSSTALHSGVNWHCQANLISYSFPFEPQSYQILSQDCITTGVQSPFEM